MKKTTIKIGITACALMAAISLFSQQTQHEVTVVNVSVPVRVFVDKTFIDDLKIEDFELTENGVPQEIDALYLTNKDRVVREEEFKEYYPETGRHFLLLFQIIDYNPRLADAFDYFFNDVMLPTDSLTVQTPINIYRLSPQALQSKPPEKISKDLQGVVRKDTQIGASSYRTLLKDLKRIVRSLASAAGGTLMQGVDEESGPQTFGLDFMLPRYRETLQKMESLRVVDERRLLGFAGGLKRMKGQKYIFFFYQREFRPEIQARVLNNLITMNQDKPNVQGDLMDLMNFYHRDSRINLPRMRNAFSDAGVFLNFIFMNKEPENISGVHMREQSEDVFETMTAIAKATGGVIDTSQNPFTGFKNGCRIAENYYILYYTPKNYRADEQFKTIEVTLKRSDKKYAISHRIGYLAR